jgi:hypothetical protein
MARVHAGRSHPPGGRRRKTCEEEEGEPGGGGSDYLAAVRAAAAQAARERVVALPPAPDLSPLRSRQGGRGSGGGGGGASGPAASPAAPPKDERARTLERLHALYEGGLVVAAPFLKAAHAQPLALLNPYQSQHQTVAKDPSMTSTAPSAAAAAAGAAAGQSALKKASHPPEGQATGHAGATQQQGPGVCVCLA